MATGRIAKTLPSSEVRNLDAIRDAAVELEDVAGLYDANPIVSIGPYFKTVQQLWRSGDSLLAKASMANDTRNYQLNPLAIYSAFLTAVPLTEGRANSAFVPLGIKRLSFGNRVIPQDFWVNVTLIKQVEEFIEFDAEILDDDGKVLMSCNGCTLKQVHQTKEVRVATIATEITADPSQDCRLYLSACIASLTGEADPAYDKSFLELGLSSAAILRLMTHLEKDLGVTLEATDLFEYPNIETLADYLSDLRVKSPDRKPSTETKSIDNVITTLEKLVAGSINAAEAEQLIDAEDRL